MGLIFPGEFLTQYFCEETGTCHNIGKGNYYAGRFYQVYKYLAYGHVHVS